MDVDAHPNPVPNPYHRKIELQSPLDLAYLQANIARSAREKLDLHFPPSASQPAPATHIPLDGPAFSSQSQKPPQNQSPNGAPLTDPTSIDPMRARVQSLVESFLTQTWDGAKHSISINGIDATSIPSTHPANPNPALASATGPVENIDFTYAPYDHSLQKRVAALHAELEALTTQVSKLRRDAPSRAARTYGEKLEETIEMERSEYEQNVEKRKPYSENANVLELEAADYTETSATYERGLGELSRLGGMGGESGLAGGSGSGSLTETVGKVQRARTVAMELD